MFLPYKHNNLSYKLVALREPTDKSRKVEVNENNKLHLLDKVFYSANNYTPSCRRRQREQRLREALMRFLFEVVEGKNPARKREIYLELSWPAIVQD